MQLVLHNFLIDCNDDFVKDGRIYARCAYLFLVCIGNKPSLVLASIVLSGKCTCTYIFAVLTSRRKVESYGQM